MVQPQGRPRQINAKIVASDVCVTEINAITTDRHQNIAIELLKFDGTTKLKFVTD